MSEEKHKKVKLEKNVTDEVSKSEVNISSDVVNYYYKEDPRLVDLQILEKKIELQRLKIYNLIRIVSFVALLVILGISIYLTFTGNSYGIFILVLITAFLTMSVLGSRIENDSKRNLKNSSNISIRDLRKTSKSIERKSDIESF